MKLSARHFQKGFTTTSLHSRGFTLVELLVVIAIVGILAAALVATIDPLEQIKKAQDTTNKNTSVEYLNAITRYYGTNQQYPWTLVTNPCGTPNGATIKSLSSGVNNCTSKLTEEGELKKSFSTARGIDKIFVTYYGAPSERIAVCFKPTSKSQQRDALTIYNDKGDDSDASSCKAQGGANDCHWCAQ